MINTILDFMKECPLLRGATFNINYTDPVPLACSVGQTGEVRTISRYSDGGKVQSFDAEVSLRCPYTGAEQDNVNSADLCSQVEQWILQCDKRGILPVLKGDKRPVSMEIVKGFRLAEAFSVDGVYRCTLRLIYFTY